MHQKPTLNAADSNAHVKHFKRRSVVIALFLVLAIALVFTGLYEGTNQATALPIPTLPSITIPMPHLLLASQWSPANGATEVAVDVAVSVHFNWDLKAGAISDSTFYIQKIDTVAHLPASLSYSTVTDNAILTPQVDLLPGTKYRVTLTSAIEDKDGYNLINASSWSFTTDAWPQIVSRNPAPDAVNVPLDQTISVTFSKNMAAATFTNNSFYVKKSGGNKVAAVILVSLDKKTALINPIAALEAGTVYEVTMTPAVESEAGIPATEVPSTWSFTTIAGAPAVTTKVPAADATGVPVNQTISATFDKDMDATTLTSATFYIAKSGGSPLPATVTYNAGTRTVTLDPLADLEAGATYQVTLSNAVKGASSIVLTGAPVVWSFTTVASAPTVTTKVPAAGAVGVPVGQMVSATFDKDMDATTLTSATFYIQKSGGSPLPATVMYNAGTRTATLDPLADLESNATYQVTLSSAIKSGNNIVLAGAPVVWSFTTAGGTSSFSDVIPGVTPYSTAIAALAADEIITGFLDGTFRPNDFVTRQQFAKMIVLTMGFPVTGAEVCPFTDVIAQIGADPFYPSKYVAVCAARGIAQGKTPTIFAPYETITHQQLISMVARAATLSSPPVSFTPNFTAGQFSLNDHYLNARKASYAGLLDGLLGIGPSYNFMAGSTRGECAQLLYSLMVLLGS
jgi:hypothetical protein